MAFLSFFFLSQRGDGVSDQRNNFWGHFPSQSCDGFIFRCDVNVITCTEKVLSRSPSRRSEPFMSDEAICIRGSQTLTQHLISSPRCQKVFCDGRGAPLISSGSSRHRPAYFTIVSGLTARRCQTLLQIKLYLLFSCFRLGFFSPPITSDCVFYSFIFILIVSKVREVFLLYLARYKYNLLSSVFSHPVFFSNPPPLPGRSDREHG